MIESLLSTGQVPGVTTDDVMARWRKREELGTTGIGHHIAVPHIRHPRVERLVGCLAHSVEGIDFDALDDEPVHLLMFYLIPADRPKEAFRALDLLARMV
jgi:PTS system fructose-specific IIA component/PTS system nitrogen regulatory IIA component